ncbi:MAG TPA: zinc ribbon domain-containing protein [Thermomicrobiales bacterium]|nr:zinc ribbon domain-containing protein [Thermomicrobiales bacterium]
MNCPACDTAVVANARFCHACGARLAPASNSHPLIGAPETDRLPAWLKQELESSTTEKQDAGRPLAAASWPRPIPDGGLSQSMPAWLSPDASKRNGSASGENTPPPSASVPFHEQKIPADDQTATIDVASFLSTDDLPAWIRRIADPAIAEQAAPATPEPAPKPQPQSQPQPQPLARIGSRAAQPWPASPPAERPAVAPDLPVLAAPHERMAPHQPDVVETRSPEASAHSTGIPRHLLLFVAILAAVAIAGYAIYLASFN